MPHRRVLAAQAPGLLVLTDPERMPDPVAVARRLPAGTGLIYRHFGEPDRSEVALALREATQQRRAALLIAADPYLAGTVGADGVHWPERHWRHARVWRHRRSNWISTIAAHGQTALVRAAEIGVDAALLSPVFATRSASAAERSTLGPLRFAAMANSVDCPVYALGGVRRVTARRLQSSARGFAVIDAALTTDGESTNALD